MTDLWIEASHDVDAERQARNLEMAKAASQGTWEFLALAQSPEEYGDRVALAAGSITAVASRTGVPVEELVEVFDRRFALLMEAANPFADDDDDDSDDSSDDSDSDSDDNDDSGDDDSSDDSDDDGDDDNDSDDSGDDDDDSSDDGDSDDDKDSAPPWANKYASLAHRIQSGENPLEWGGTPFGRSSVRKEAADGAPVSDTNVPTPEAPSADPIGSASPSLPGMDGGIAETTKPRQEPGGGGMDPSMAPGMGMDGIPAPATDPAMNGGDIQQGSDDLPPAEAAKIAAIAQEVRQYNPTLSEARCQKVARQVYKTYLHKHAEDMSPLLFGDRGHVPDGPATDKVKNWSPPDIKPVDGAPSIPEGGGDDGDGQDGGGGLGNLITRAPIQNLITRAPGAAGAGEAAAGAGEAAAAARMLPLLAL